MKMARRGSVAVIAFVFAIAPSFFSTPSRAADALKDIPWKIDQLTAQRLAVEAYLPQQRMGMFDPSPGMSAPFFVFDGLNESPANGSFGFFAVNPWTGDVWDLWGCFRLMTPALHLSQFEIRQRFSQDELKHYAELSSLRPDCIVDLNDDD